MHMAWPLFFLKRKVTARECTWSLGPFKKTPFKHNLEELQLFWVVVSDIFYFHPYLGRFPFWLIFVKWVETTNQFWLNHQITLIPSPNLFNESTPRPDGGDGFYGCRSWAPLPWLHRCRRMKGMVWFFQRFFRMKQIFHMKEKFRRHTHPRNLTKIPTIAISSLQALADVVRHSPGSACGAAWREPETVEEAAFCPLETSGNMRKLEKKKGANDLQFFWQFQYIFWIFWFNTCFWIFWFATWVREPDEISGKKSCHHFFQKQMFQAKTL